MAGSNQAPALLVFLGNPGRDYKRTRHNVGWMVGEEFLNRIAPAATFKQKFHGRFATIAGVTLLFPETYMNHSGRSARAAADFFGTEPARILAIHDDMELPFGTVQLSFDGGLRGHNGLKSIRQHLNTTAFWRLRIGVGRPIHPGADPTAHVLARYSKGEETRLPDIVAEAVGILERAITHPKPAEVVVPT